MGGRFVLVVEIPYRLRTSHLVKSHSSNCKALLVVYRLSVDTDVSLEIPISPAVVFGIPTVMTFNVSRRPVLVIETPHGHRTP